MDGTSDGIDEMTELGIGFKDVVEQLGFLVYIESVEVGAPLHYVSRGIERFLGAPAAELRETTQRWEERIHPDDLERYRSVSRHSDDNGTPFSHDYRVCHPDGRVFWVHDEAVLVRNDTGNPRYWLGTIQDITEPRKVSDILGAVALAARRFLTTDDWQKEVPEVLEALGHASASSRAYVYKNSVRDDGELLMSEIAEWVAPGIESVIDRPENKDYPYSDGYDHYVAALGLGEVVHGPARTAPPRERGWEEKFGALTSAVVPIHVGDEWWGFIGFDDCAHEHEWSEAELEALTAAADTVGAAIRRAELHESLEETRRDYRTLVEQIPAVVYVERHSEPEETLYVSPQVEEILGISADKWRHISEDDWTNLVHPEDRERFSVEYEKYLAGGPHLQDYRVVRPDGRIIWIRDRATLLREDDGTLVERGIMVDVTEQKEIERQLQEAELSADQANKAKSQFLSRMSHELRTPLNAVLGFTQLLAMEDPRPNQIESLGLIERAGRHLLDLVNEILDISRIEAGRLGLWIEPVHLGDALEQAIDLMRPFAAEHEVAIGMGTQYQWDRYVMADPQRLKQVLLNLLSNAVKYNREGGRVDIACSEIPQRRIRIQVADTGAGIPENMAERVFEPFDRLRADLSGQEGTGLGLTLTKALVEAMGGEISFESREGEGSTFSIDLVLAGPSIAVPGTGAAEAEHAAGPDSSTRTLLVVENDPMERLLLERIVDRIPGMRMVSAADETAGIELARRFLPDLMLLDLHAGDAYGESLLRSLREDPRTHDIPVVVLTEEAASHTVERLTKASASTHLTRPLDVARLLDILRDI